MEKVPVMLYDLLSGDREIVFVLRSVRKLDINLNGRNYKVSLDARACMTVATFMDSYLEVVHIANMDDAKRIVQVKFEKDLMNHTLFRCKGMAAKIHHTASRLRACTR
jgi:hypothetical protein